MQKRIQRWLTGHPRIARALALAGRFFLLVYFAVFIFCFGVAMYVGWRALQAGY